MIPLQASWGNNVVWLCKFEQESGRMGNGSKETQYLKVDCLKNKQSQVTQENW